MRHVRFALVGIVVVVLGGLTVAPPLPAVAAPVFTGRVVDATTGVPLEGVRVAATDTAGSIVPGTTVLTDALGRFRVGGDLGEEHGVWFDGNTAGHERGWLGGLVAQPFGRSVVGTWGEAATYEPGKLGTIGLDRVAPPLVPVKVSLVSPAPNSLTLRAQQNPRGDRATSFEVRCTRRLVTVTRIYSRSGTTRTGFTSGLNTCRVRGVNSAGRSPWVTMPVTVD